MEALNIWNLQPGIAIRIVKSFRDYYKHEFTEGTILHFEKRDYLPYESGHTVYFKEGRMYLSDLDDTSAIVENLRNEYFVVSDT